FSVRDIVIFARKFIVENLEQYVSISHACVIASAPKRPCVITSRSFNQDANISVIDESAAPFPTLSTSTHAAFKTVQIQKGKKKLSDLALDCLEITVMDNDQNRHVYTEDASEDDDLELL
ncbi:4876_t:CDS:2, partial [Cetraspora pellucida]